MSLKSFIAFAAVQSLYVAKKNYRGSDQFNGLSFSSSIISVHEALKIALIVLLPKKAWCSNERGKYENFAQWRI